MVGPLRKRRFCARSGQGSSARIRVEASSIKTKTTSGGKDEQGKGEGPPGGGRLPPEQRSSRESKGQKQGFLLQHFPSGQEGRRAQASHKPEWTQRLHQEKDFSNGFTERRISISAQGRLGCHYRPESRLPARPHSGAAQTLSPILVEGQHDFAKTTCQCYWPIIIRICSIFPRFRDRDHCCFSPSIWEILRLPQIIQE